MPSISQVSSIQIIKAMDSMLYNLWEKVSVYKTISLTINSVITITQNYLSEI